MLLVARDSCDLLYAAYGGEYCATDSASDAADNECLVVEVVVTVHDCGGGRRGVVGGPSGEEVAK